MGRWQFPWELSSACTAEWTLLILNTKVCAAHKILMRKKTKQISYRGLLAQDLESMCLCSPLFEVHIHTSYLSFFLHRQNFWRIKFPQKFTQLIANLHSKLPIFRVKSVKIYTKQFFFTPVTNMRYGYYQYDYNKGNYGYY